MLVLSLMLWKAEMLVRLGLTGRVYYIALLPLGLSAAAFLFGALRSYAIYTGNHRRRAGIGRADRGFALTVIGGFVLVPESSTFAVTVFVHGEAGVNQIVLRKSGKVILDLGGDRRSEGSATRGRLSSRYSSEFPRAGGACVNRAEGYDLAKPGQNCAWKALALSDGSSRAGRISGRVQDEEGKPLVDVVISVAGSR